MVFDFAARPPEINSTLMYSGAGAGPMMAAASTFGGLSSELSSNATAYESVISQLTGSEWTGPSATAAAAAAQQEHRMAEHHLRAVAGSGRQGHRLGGGIMSRHFLPRFRHQWSTPTVPSLRRSSRD